MNLKNKFKKIKTNICIYISYENILDRIIYYTKLILYIYIFDGAHWIANRSINYDFRHNIINRYVGTNINRKKICS